MALLLAVLGALVFSSVARNGFVNLDDPTYLTANPNVQLGLNAQGIAWAFTTSHGGNWHPLTWISLMLDTQLWGINPAYTHLVNAALHLANSVLLFYALVLLTSAPWRSVMVAALFELHPLHVESVAWVAERKDVLSSLFFMLVLICYAKSRLSANGKPGPWYWAVHVFFILGLLAKPMLVTVPLILVLLDFWPLSRFQRGSFSKSLISSIREKLGLIVITLIFCIITIYVQNQGGAVQGISSCPLDVRLENAVVSVIRYLRRTIAPYELATPYEDIHAWSFAIVSLAVVLISLVSLFVFRVRASRPFLLFGWLWFLVMLVPVIGLVQVGAQSMADRYTYLPLIGIFIGFVWSMEKLNFPKSLKAFLAGTLVVLCVWGSTVKIGHWRSTETLLKRAIAVTGHNWIAHYNLGVELEEQGRTPEALEYFRAAASINPRDADCQNRYGFLLAKTGDYGAALECFTVAFHDRPTFLDLHYNLANALFHLKRYEEAVPHYRAYLELHPQFVAAHNELGIALGTQGKLDEAVSEFKRAIELQPNGADAYFNLAEAQLLQDENAQAISNLKTALRLKPGWHQAEDELHKLEAK